MPLGPKLPRSCVLRDGQKLVLRPITPADRDALRAAFLTLSPAARYSRFLGHVADLSPQMLSYLTEVDGVDHFAVVAVPAGRPKRGAPIEIMAVGRFIRLRDEQSAAEVAVTVRDELQGLGCGSQIFATLVEAACERGVDRLVAHVLDENTPMRKLLAHTGPLTKRSDGAVNVTLARPPRAPRAPRSLRRGRQVFARALVALFGRPTRRTLPSREA
jgi:RimJ/RimL family protein N-acetyltransferase